MKEEDEREKEKSFVERIKGQLFILMQSMMENSEIGFPRVLFTKLFEFLILLSFSFHDRMEFVWEPSELYTNFLKWFNILRITFIASQTTTVMLLIVFFTAGGFTLACWLLLIFGVRFAAYGTVPSAITSILKVIVSIFPTIIYMEVLDISLSMLNCKNNPNGEDYLYMTESTSQKIYCWNGAHTVYVCIAGGFVLLQAAFAFLVVTFDLEMKMKSKNYTARASNILEVFGLVQRSCIVVAILVFGYESKKIIGFTLILMSSIKLVLGMVMEPYHSKSTQMLVLSLNAIETWVNISLNMEIFLGWIEFSMNTLLAILGSPVFAVMIVYVWHERNTNLLQLKAKNSKSYDLYLKMRKLIEIYEHSDDMENAVWLNGLLSRHVQRCKKESCQLHEEFRKIISATSIVPGESVKAYSNYINMKYKKVIRSDPQSTFLRIAYALFLSEYVKNRVYALTQLEEAQGLNPSITEQLLLARYKSVFESELAEEKMLVNKMTQSNIELAIKFEALCTKFKAALLDSATAFTELWGYLKNETASSFQLEKMINKIYDQGRIVDDTWEEILQIKGDIPKTLYMHAQYQFRVINDPKTAMILDKKARTEEIIQAQAHQENELTLKDMRNISDYASDGTPCIYISALPEKLGQITNINMSACQLFGYPKNSLLARNIKALIPEIIGKKHSKALAEAEKKEVSYFTKRRNFFTYGRQMTGYIFPLYINVKKVLSFSLQGDQYGALMYPLQSVAKSQEMHMLIDLKLNITDLTESCYRTLKIRKEVVKRQKVPITTIIPKFPTVERLEQELQVESEGYNQLVFAEEELDVYFPQILEKPRSDSSSKLQYIEEEGVYEEDDSVFSTLRKNEISSNDSFIHHEHYMQLDHDDEQNEDQESNAYNIMVTEDKIRCKVGVSLIHVTGSVGYAVRLIRMDLDTNPSAATLNPKIGRYQLRFNTGTNCFIRVPVDSSGRSKDSDPDYFEEQDMGSSRYKGNENKSPLSIVLTEWKRENKQKGTCAFFRPVILAEKLRDLNKRMSKMRPDEIVETLTPEFFDKLRKQRIYDTAVKLKEVKKSNGEFLIQEKQQQSTSQFFEKEKFEDIGEGSEERKAVSARAKGEKADVAIEDKDGIKESLERQRRSPWIARAFITIIVAFLLGLMTLSILGHVYTVRLFEESEHAYHHAETSTRKTAELLYIKSHIRSLIFENRGWINAANNETDFHSRQKQMNESYTTVKEYEESLRTSGTGFTDKSDIDGLLAKLIDVELKAANLELIKQYMFAEMNNQMLSSIFGILQFELSHFLDFNETIYFFMQNTVKKGNNYMDGLLQTIELYKAKAAKLDEHFDHINLLFFLISFCFTLFMILIILIIYLKIRKSKLYVMSFFIHIPSKSLEEILQNCDEFISGLTMTEARIADVEESERDLLQRSREEETGSSVSVSQQQYYKRYKKHQPRHNRVLSDDCRVIFWTILKFFAQFMLVAIYFLTYFLVAMGFHESLAEAGLLSEKNSLVELNSINILVLMKESINSDSSSSTLSTMYTQLNDVIMDTISLMKGLENIHQYKKIDSSLFDSYEDLVLKDLCSDLSLSSEDCQKVANGIVKLGLLTVVAYYRRQTRELYKYFLSVRFDPNAIKTDILNSETMQEFEPLMFNVIKPVARKLSDDILGVIERISSTNSSVQSSLLITFIVLLILTMVFFIFPYMNTIRNDMSKLHYTLAGIPLEILVANNKFMQYIGKQKI